MEVSQQLQELGLLFCGKFSLKGYKEASWKTKNSRSGPKQRMTSLVTLISTARAAFWS